MGQAGSSRPENAGTGGELVAGKLALFGAVAAVALYPKVLIAVAVLVLAGAVVGVKR